MKVFNEKPVFTIHQAMLAKEFNDFGSINLAMNFTLNLTAMAVSVVADANKLVPVLLVYIA
jgi:hypothetical protein